MSDEGRHSDGRIRRPMHHSIVEPNHGAGGRKHLVHLVGSIPGTDRRFPFIQADEVDKAEAVGMWSYMRRPSIQFAASRVVGSNHALKLFGLAGSRDRQRFDSEAVFKGFGRNAETADSGKRGRGRTWHGHKDSIGPRGRKVPRGGAMEPPYAS